jgi:cytochrome c-type biogenesis protein CcmE
VTRKQQRLGLLALGMAALAGATTLVLVAFSDNLVFFYSPSELKSKAVGVDRRVRIGGLVETGSVMRSDGRRISFRVTDGAADLAVVYDGILPDLFREGQGVVAEGRLRPDGVFTATTVLAKHDENYMPREVVEALKKSGHWQEGGGPPPPPPPPPGGGGGAPGGGGGGGTQIKPGSACMCAGWCFCWGYHNS